MNAPKGRNQGPRRILTCFLALTMPLAGLSFGAGQGSRDPAARTEDARLASNEAAVPGGSGQIEPGSALAAKIEKRSLVVVLTPSGTMELQKPLVVAGGVKSQMGPSISIPWSEIQNIRYQGRATLSGMWIGGGSGAAIGTAIGIALVADEESVYWWSIPLFGAAAGAIGAGAGALIGSMFPKWKTLYESPAKPRMVARVSMAPVRRGGMMTLTLAF